MDELTHKDYLRQAEATLQRIEAAADAIDLDSKREGSVLTLEFDSGDQVIVNLQPAIDELWLASRFGAYHFRHADGAWRDTREGREFDDLLLDAVTALGGVVLPLQRR
jgi:CyaY protein